METYDSFGTRVEQLQERPPLKVDSKEPDARTAMSLEASAWQERVNPTAREYRNSWVRDLLEDGNYKVERGDSLWIVARRTLGVTGHADATGKEIAREVRRIAELNDIKLDSKGRPIRPLTVGTTLEIGCRSERFASAGKPGVTRDNSSENSDFSPPRSILSERACDIERPRVQVSRGVAKAGMCDKMDVSDTAFVTVRPGADVLLRSGARAFVFGGKVVGEANSRIFAAGGEIEAHPGASVKFIGNDAKVMHLDVVRNVSATQATDAESKQAQLQPSSTSELTEEEIRGL